MSATPNLAIEHILQSQAQKEVTANEAFDALDQATAGLLEVDVSSGGTITVDPAAALQCKMLRLTGTLAGDAEVVVPDNRKPYFVHNATADGFAITVGTAAGAGVDHRRLHTLVRVWDGHEVRQYVDGLRTNTTAVTATGSWPLYRFGYQFTAARRSMRPTCRSSARSAPPGTMPWWPAGAPIPSACSGRRGMRRSSMAMTVAAARRQRRSDQSSSSLLVRQGLRAIRPKRASAACGAQP